MKSLREVGLKDLNAVNSRALRLAAMGRISAEDANKVVLAVRRVEGIITTIIDTEEVDV